MVDSLKQFQQDFGRYLRDPSQVALPDGVPAARANIYEDLLFNNLSGFLNSCFPITRAVLGDATWLSLRRAFFRDWRCHSPYFLHIPEEFVQFLQQSTPPLTLPPWLQSLAHYEWVELAVDTCSAENQFDENCENITLNRSLMICEYAWPVQKISVDYRPEAESPTYLAVYRNAQCKVKFSELSAATFLLLEIIEQTHGKREDIARCFAELAPGADWANLNAHIDQALNELALKGILQLPARH